MINVIIIILLFLSCAPQEDKYFKTREEMVNDQIESRGISNQPTLDAMKKVSRHKFVPPNLLDRAYDDGPLPIGYGQTISQPYIVAYMTSVIDPKPDNIVLEIGTGSGYQAAVLAEIIDSVFTIEIVTELYRSSEKRLKELGYKNVLCKNADGYYGWKKYAPFDAIIVTAAAEYIPPPLIEQLKDGGKMIIPVGSPFLNQTLILVEKNGVEITTTSLLPVRFVPFTRGN
ncbi:MAG: protein-L-isoaspartate O-methyltransferase [Ignavibacteria bacterium RBG_16_36_9]|jgi:protein-L-isoaspartate(D-aspartate) O-methyltransferase|nr:MAG: protein-L-isoaspartate O-methyltransferase [Ignavibacteria bacterium RBG_16_36_9]